ncbi:MAG TPA: tetratricopeptide repeat protein [Thermoguttaceae bacterium]
MKLFSLRILLGFAILVTGMFCLQKSAVAQTQSTDETGSVTPEKPPQIQEITDAMARFRERDVEGALKYLEEASKKNPDLPPAHVMLASFYERVKAPQGIIQSLELGIQKYPDDPEAYILLSQIALRDRRVAEANLLLNKANELLAKFDKSAKRKETLSNVVASGLAQVYQLREDWATAQKYLEQWLKSDPKNAMALQRLAYVLFQQKNAQAALEKLREAKNADSNVITPEATLALFYQQYPDPENAKKWMAAALSAAPKDLRTQLLAANLALENGQLDEAQTRAKTAMQIDPKSLEAKIIRGTIALFQKDYKSAEDYLESAHIQSPGNFSAYNNLALALIEQKDQSKKRRALEIAEGNVRQYRNSSDAASTLGWILYKLGRLEDADTALQTAISAGTFSADTGYYAAVVASERGRKEEAKRLLQMALKSTSPFPMKQDAAALLEKLSK